MPTVATADIHAIAPKPQPTVVTFAKGDPVPWPPAPGGLAQVDDVLRTRVRLVYAARTGRLRFPVVRAERLARLAVADPVLPMANPFGRGAVRGRVMRVELAIEEKR